MVDLRRYVTAALIVAGMSVPGGGLVAAPDDTRQPNIVLYLVDDMGWMDTSVLFAGKSYPLNEKFHTPNMERLAREGMLFTNAYAAPVCTPSRVSLVTGMNVAHHGITSWTHIERDRPSDFDGEDSPVRAPDWNINGLSPVAGIPRTVHATPLPRLLQDAGYFTLMAGKAHFASMGTPGANPLNLGFVGNIAGSMAGQPENYLPERNYGNNEEDWSHRSVQNMVEYYGSDVYLTDALTSEALKPLEYPIRKGDPFFLYFGQYAVHLPNNANPAFVDKYLEAGLPEADAGYASMIESLDKSLGDIMDFLEREGVADNTVVIFMSDNGGNSTSKAKGGVLHHGNHPLRAGKGSVYEGGIRTPMIVRWPGVVEPGSVTDAPVIIEDFFPTILEIARVKNRETVQTVDGQSFLPVLKDASAGDRDRAMLWHYPNRWKREALADVDFMGAYREGDWKLVYRMTTGSLELYNLEEDIGEQRNLASENPEKLAELADAMSKQLREWDAQMPILKATGKPVPYPDEVLKEDQAR